MNDDTDSLHHHEAELQRKSLLAVLKVITCRGKGRDEAVLQRSKC